VTFGTPLAWRFNQSSFKLGLILDNLMHNI